MILKSPILLLFACLFGFLANCQNIEFVENKGQWDSRVLYAGKVPSGIFFIHKDGYTVLQNNDEDMAELHEVAHAKTLHGKPVPNDHQFKLRSHAYRVYFEGTEGKTDVSADKALPGVNNYFIGNDPSKWASGCRIFQGITVKNIYNNIDIRYYSESGTLKYDLIVKPGGNVPDIVMKYDGADKLEVKNKELHVGTSVGILRELSPYTYQPNAKGRETVPVQFKVSGNRVRFEARKYNKDVELVIDPTMIFCSLTGSVADNWGFTATYGPDGSFFGGGIVSNNGFPVSPGAFQTNYGGGGGCLGEAWDIGIMKLSPNGSNRVYATYIGGSGDEMPQSLICTPAGELIVAGRSKSPNYPGTTVGTGGNWDIIVTKLNASGTALIGSKKIGGDNDDGANITDCGGGPQSLQRNYGDEFRSEVNIDAAGNIYLASCTQSTNFPVQGAFQASFGGGTQDGVVLKFDPGVNLLFGSYLGGDKNDASYVLALNPVNNDIYVAGGTESSTASFPGNKTNTIGPAFVGNVDGFVSIISNNGASIKKSTFLGTGGIDQVYGIQFDKIGFPYVMGQTTGTWPIQNVKWSQPGGKQFISKLEPDLSAYVYSTTLGKGAPFPDFSPVAFLVDRCENVYVSGWGGGTLGKYPTSGVQGLPVTPDAYKSVPDVGVNTGQGQDFYFFVLERNAKSQLYGSFFGQNSPTQDFGDHVDGGTSRFDQNGVIYQAICANCSNQLPYPTTPQGSVWASVKPASNLNCNLAMVKMEFNFAGVGSAVQSSIMGVPRDTAGCVPLTVDFRDTLLEAVRYYWNFGDGSPMVSTTKADTSHIYTSVGQFRVMLIAEDSTTCNIRDTSYITIKVGASQASVDFVPKRIDTCTKFRFQFDNTSVAPAGFPFSAKSFVWDFGDGTARVTTGSSPVTHAYAAPGTYKVKLYLNDTTYCNSPDSTEKTVRVAPFVKAGFNAPKTGCAPLDVVFDNTSLGGAQFVWDFGDGTTSTDMAPLHTFGVGTFTITLTAIDSGTCNVVDIKQATITVLGKPTALFTASPQPPVINLPIAFTNASTPDAVRFKWIFGDGDSVLTNSRNVVSHEYNATGTFNACLVAINSAGCPDTVCQDLRTQVVPALDVPNAFTPLSKDGNNKVYARGFGIAKMKFTIYSRWGEKVFETADKHIGWDGRYKGELLPMDVYAYTLDAEFYDGTKAVKKGDITLIR